MHVPAASPFFNRTYNEAFNLLVEARDVLSQTTITAPSDGIVIGLSLVTVGGVVEPGKPIMDIVPFQTDIVVSAKFSPLDIDEIRLGMRAELHLSGYAGGATPAMNAAVIHIAADRMTDPQTGMPYYDVHLRLPPEEVAKVAPMALIAGMSVDVVLPVQPRTLFAYLVDPLRSRLRKGMRER